VLLVAESTFKSIGLIPTVLPHKTGGVELGSEGQSTGAGGAVARTQSPLAPAHPGSSFIAGGVAAGVATAAVYPLDMVRTRLVGQKEPRVYRSMAHAVQTIFRSEGPLAFYKGLVPSLGQIVPGAAVQFGAYRVLTMELSKTGDFNTATSALVGALLPHGASCFVSSVLSGRCRLLH
jgi:hypothetical protein